MPLLNKLRLRLFGNVNMSWLLIDYPTMILPRLENAPVKMAEDVIIAQA